MHLLAAMTRAAMLAGAALCAGAPTRAAESPDVAHSERAEVKLYADVDRLAPGGEAILALHQVLAPHWHSYWRNPGDSGLETTIVWTAPEGVEIGPIEWPAPRRIPVPPFMNYGYEDEAILLSRLRLPADWPAGRPLDVRAEADWLVCEEQCIPEHQSFTLSLATGASAGMDPVARDIVARGLAAQAAPLAAPARALMTETVIRLRIEAPELAAGLRDDNLRDLYFFADQERVVSPSAEQTARVVDGALELTLTRGDLAPEGAVSGVLRGLDRSGGAPVEMALQLSATLTQAALAPAAPSGGPAATQLGLGLSPSLAAAATLAFLGGLILNLMPCVFPILALKALSFAKGADHGGGERLRHGLAYGAGVLASFLALAALLVALKSAGATVGWGFQLQTPIVVAGLAFVLFAVGLNLSGVYEVPGALSNLGGGLAGREGPAGSFFTGVLAVAVASPCTAPFMGAALGYALTHGGGAALTVFAALGLGFAAPLVALSAAPGLSRALPRPGAWMIRFRQALAFPMYLAAAWMLWVLGHQAGLDAVFAAMIGLVLLSMALWALGVGWPASRTGRGVAAAAAAIGLLGAILSLEPSLNAVARAERADAATEGALWERFDPNRLETLRAEGRTVFVNLTADWCISCKFNERVALSGDAFEAALSDAGAIYMKGDWTSRDPEITAMLARFGRVGVPLYVVYRGAGAPTLLPQLLSAGVVREALTGV